MSRYSDFHILYDAVITPYPAYSPYTPAGLKNQYVNDLSFGGWRRAAAAARYLTTSPLSIPSQNNLPCPLLGPEDSSIMASDPGFEWAPVSGAARYYLTVSRQPDFSIDTIFFPPNIHL